MSKHKHITEPSSTGFQVRIVRDRKEYSRYFAHKLWGSKAKSLKGAINWRDQTLVLIGDKKPTPIKKKSTGVVGVTRTIQFCKGVHALVYSCHWRRNNKGHTKAFQVGVVHKVTADQEFHAFRTAVQFRKEYEFFKDTGKEHLFSPEKYKLWRTEKMYGLSTLEPSITPL